jgi:excisionase family DNA binding protein
MALRGRNSSSNQEEEKVVEINAQMQGSLVFKDPISLKINGEFNGSLDTKGTLSIGNTASIVANISGDNVIIAGKIDGDIIANKMLTLMPTAVLKGNITAPKLNIVEGAIFQGKCKMLEGNSGTDEDLLDMDEVSKYLEIDLSEIKDLANSGKIPGTRSGDSWKFERAQIDHWAASGRIK